MLRCHSKLAVGDFLFATAGAEKQIIGDSVWASRDELGKLVSRSDLRRCNSKACNREPIVVSVRPPPDPRPPTPDPRPPTPDPPPP